MRFLSMAILISSMTAQGADLSKAPSFACKVESMASADCSDQYEPGGDTLFTLEASRGLVYPVHMRTHYWFAYPRASNFFRKVKYKEKNGIHRIYGSRLDYVEINTKTGVGRRFDGRSESEPYLDLRVSGCKIVDFETATAMSKDIHDNRATKTVPATCLP